MTTCVICLGGTSAIHWHHTIPQSRGGEHSQQIPLCGTCHTQLHANGVAVVAKIRGSRRPLEEFWPNAEQRERAQHWLEILVAALLAPPITDERRHLLSVKVPTKVYEEFKLLQADQGISSLEKTLDFCISFTIQTKGLRDVRSEKGPDQLASMWFMHVHRTREDI